jgi:GGDEF domain-containing protein
MAWTDPVTSSPTSGKFLLALEVAVGHAQAAGQSLSLLWIQIDGCSGENAEKRLGRVAKALRLAIESDHVLARGAECHFLLMLRAVPLASAMEVARRIQAAIALAASPLNEVSTTLSIGAACGPARQGWDGGDLLRVAGNRCKAAQVAGGDRVVMYGGEAPGWPSEASS